MSRSLGTLTLDLIARMGGFEQGMDRAARVARDRSRDIERASKDSAARFESQWSAAAKNVTSFLGAIGAGAVFAGFIRNTVNAANEQAQLAAVIRSTGQAAGYSIQQLNDMATQIAKVSTLSAGEVNQAQTTLLAFTGIVGDQFPKALQAAVDMAARTGMSVVSAAETIGRALDIPSQGLTALSRQGFRFTEEQKKLAQQLEDTGRTAEAQGIILDALTESYGGAAEAARGTLGGALAALRNTLDDIFTGSSEAFAPIVSGIESLNTALSSGVAEDALKAISYAAAGLAAIFAGRLVTSILASSVAFVSATAEAARYQMVLARMAGVGSAAAASIGAFAFAARAASSLLGVLGGPIGVLATVGLTAAGFMAMSGSARAASLNVDELASSFETLTQKQLELRRIELDEEVAKLEKKAIESSQALDGLRKDFDALGQAAARGANITAAELENVKRTILEQSVAHDTNSTALDKARLLLDQVVGRLQQLDQDARNAAGGVGVLNEALTKTNEAGQKYLERLKDQSITAGLRTQREQLEAMVKAGALIYAPDDLKKAREYADKIDKGTASLKSGTKATKDYAAAMKSLLETHLPQNHALEELHKNLDLLGKAHKAGKVSAADYTKALLSLNTAYAKQVTDLLPESVKKVRDQVKAAQDQKKALEQQIRTFGLAESAVTRLAVADTDSAIAKLEAAKASAVAGNASTERVREIEAEIHALKQLKDLQLGISGQQQQLEFRAAQKAQWEEWERDVEQIFQNVGQSLTDAIFDGGKSGKELLRDMFKSLTFNILINPVMKSLQGFVTNEIGALFGYNNPQQQSGVGGMLQNASSLNSIFGAGYQALTGASAGASTASLGYANLVGAMGGDSIGALISANGGWEGALSGLGSAAGASLASGIASVAPSVAASLGTTIGGTLAKTTASYALSGAATAGGVAGGAGAAGGAGLMGAIGGALPYLGVGLAAASAFGLFDSGPPKTRHGQRTTIDYTGGAYGISAVDDRQAAGSEQAALAAAQSAVAAANDLFAKVGVNAGIESFYAVMESSVLGDRNGVASGGMLRIGDQLRQIGIKQSSDMTFAGVGGWSSEDMLSRLQTDITLTTLEAFQALGDQLPSVLSNMLAGIDFRNIDAATAQDLATRFAAVADGATQFLTAIEALPFEQLRGLSFDAAAGLVQLAGGVENLLGAQQTYYQAYYSEAERHGIAVNNLTSALAAAGVVIPELTGSTEQMLASYRGIVEAQDLNTEAGRQAYVVLMQASGAFAEVAQYAGQVAQAVEEVAVPARSLADIERERAGLESQLLGLLGNTNALRQRELETLDASNRALQQQIWSYQDLSTAYNEVVAAGEREIARLKESFGATDTAMSAYRSDVQRLESEFGNLISTIGRGVADLRGQVTEAARMQYDQARAVISTALITRQLPQTADLTETLRIAQQGVTGQVYGSLFEQQKAYLILANEMEALQGIAQPELDTARATLAQLENQYRLLRGMSLVGEDSLTALEQQLRTAIATEEAARRQISAIEEQINWAKEQYNVLMEIRDGVLTFPEALASFAQTLAAAVAAANKAAAPVGGGGGSAGGYTPVPGADIGSSSWTTDYLYANQDVLKAYDASWGLTPEAWAQYHWDTYGKYEGRSYDVGTSYVPHDMTANIHRGEIIIDPRSSDILRRYGIGVQGGGTSRETEQLLREQLSEVRQQNRYLYEIVKSGKRTASNTEDTATAIAHGDSDGVVVVM